jgi:hypothetical protein
MNHTKKQGEKMMRLKLRLTKYGWRFWGEFDGVGESAIADNDYKTVPNSAQWVRDYLAGAVSSTHICSALRQG